MSSTARSAAPAPRAPGRAAAGGGSGGARVATTQCLPPDMILLCAVPTTSLLLAYRGRTRLDRMARSRRRRAAMKEASMPTPTDKEITVYATYGDRERQRGWK